MEPDFDYEYSFDFQFVHKLASGRFAPRHMTSKFPFELTAKDLEKVRGIILEAAIEAWAKEFQKPFDKCPIVDVVFLNVFGGKIRR